MHCLESIHQTNTEAVIRAIIARGEERGLRLSREDVLEELAAFDGTDQTIWSATVDKLLRT